MRNHGKITLMLLLAAVLVCLAVSAAAAEDGIGMVLSLEGEATALRGGAEVPLEVRSRVYESDVVSVWMDSKLQILLDDETSLTLGPDSTLDLIEFSEEAGGEKFESRLSEGSMRIITGETTERNPDGFKITTRHAAVAIRGTVLSLVTNDDFTRVDVESTKRTVLVNMQEISEFNRMTIHADGTEEITPLPVEERAGDMQRLSGAARPNVERVNAPTALAGSDVQAENIPLGAGLPAAPQAYETSESAVLQLGLLAREPEPSTPEPTAPTPVLTVPTPEPTAPTPEPTVPAPVLTVPTPEPTIPTPEPTIPMPEPTAPTPEPTIPEPVPTVPEPEPPTPEPAPVPVPPAEIPANIDDKTDIDNTTNINDKNNIEDKADIDNPIPPSSYPTESTEHDESPGSPSINKK
ncbi:MAG: FecR family protein [Synergistaceae bacterium]|nr:FecR family protein [Synergistaceae bacterium]